MRETAEAPSSLRISHSKEWMRFLLTLILVVVIVAGLWFSLTQLMNTQMPILVVEGNSMFPTLRDGDIVLLRGTSVEELISDYETGKQDIIVFFSEIYNRYIVHRVHRIVYDESGSFLGFVTKGDNNRVADPGMVDGESIKGKVVGQIPYAGFAIKFFRSPAGTALLGIAIVILVLWAALERAGSPRRD